MDAINARYAQHRIDGYGFFLDVDANEFEVMLSHEPPNPEECRPLLTLTLAYARALWAFLSLADVQAVLLAAEQEHQHSRKLFHDDPANH